MFKCLTLLCRLPLAACLLGLLLAGPALAQQKSAQAQPVSSADRPLDTVHLQLRWRHQFQFAGYYAAVEKGYYREEGLNVVLHAGAPDRQPVSEVLSQRAQYAEGNSEVLLARLQGRPLVALAAIFQHSPSVLLALRKSGIVTPHDLIGRRVMFMNGLNDADFMSMLYNEGIPREQLIILPSSYNFEDLIAGRVDAFNSYLTNEPFYLKQRGIEYTVINPINSRVDFYSDILFTTADEVKNHPQRVEAMRRATLKGWRYAMDQPDEIIDLLLSKYKVPKTRAHLEFEANAMRPLILPELIPIGSMNPERWQHMAETFALTGMISRNYSIEGFMYEDPALRKVPGWVMPLLIASLAVVAVAMLAAGYFQRTNRLLKQTEGQLRAANEALHDKVQEVTALHERLQEQAIRDPLTGLFNRRYLDETLEHELARAKRDGYALSLAMIDVDHFKTINDTYGHPAGDEVLKALGSLLQAQAREGDIVCRYGGEEFVLVSPRLPLNTALERVEQWRASLAGLRVRHGELALSVTCSAGLATYPDHAVTADALMICADQALYRAKALGRNRVEVALQE
jgi:diguanylate cyclase (GGDEF)-like protein